MKLALVVPALNEEDAIAGTLQRCLDARAKIVAETALDEMLIVFVNDGSTDRTQEIVDQPEFNEVVKVRFEKNKGYGAAIKAGYEATDADLVGFIDGDGTCNPEFCINLLNDLQSKEADVVLAARLSPESEMPFIRRLGNTIFAKLLGFMSGNSLTDSASGFRIIRRTSLKLMTPLPDGLHYTPAMSAICMLDPRLKIEEVHGMKYAEREGRSKLSVVKDGFRFLSTIMFAACCYSPIKTMMGFSVIALVGFLLLGLLSAIPATFITTLATLTILALLGAGVVVHQLNYLLIGPRAQQGPVEQLLQKIVHHRNLLFGGAIACVLGAALIWPLGDLSGKMGSFGYWLTHTLIVGGAMAGVGGVILRVIWAVGEKTHALVQSEYKLEKDSDLTSTAAEVAAGSSDETETNAASHNVQSA